MNYFRGNGGCGLSISPKYVKYTDNSALDQSVYNESPLDVCEDTFKQYNYPLEELYPESD